MKITIAAIGRLKAGPEREIAERLLSRATNAGKKVGLSFTTREFPESRAGSSKARKEQEATAISAALPSKAILVALDEHGQAIDSRTFAKHLEKWRDNGVSDVAFAIGGADGHGPSILERSDLKIAFGAMTWPHQLTRLMLAEQLYRAITILSGHPYHRD
jgi:23S rRNA (pseudouridine1915-N3)-methyltransferase